MVKKVEYDNAFMFMYSIRKGTKAADMTDQIPDEVKSDRLQRLISVQNSRITSYNVCYTKLLRG